MKRLLLGCLIPLACLATACGSSSAGSSSSAPAATSTSAAAASGTSTSAAATTGAGSSGAPLHIALVTGDNHDPFYVTMNKGAQAAAKALGATVTWQGPSVYGAQAQIQILDAVKSGHPSALLVAPDDVKALIGTLGDFKSAGVPVITVDTDVNDTSVRLGNITSDNVLGGELAEQFLAKHIPAGSKVVYVGEPPGVSTTDQREQGFVKAVKSSNLKDLTPQFGTDDDPNTAATLVSALIQRNPDLKGIFASDTAWGQGAATAVQNAGKSGQIQIVAFDAEPEEVQDLARGTIQALIVQKAYLEGYDAVSYAVNYIRHHTAVPAETHPSYVVATKANISSPDVQKYVYAQK